MTGDHGSTDSADLPDMPGKKGTRGAAGVSGRTGSTTASCALRRLLQADLACVLAWRNHVDTRRWMFSTGLIEWDDHVAWFGRVDDDPDREALIFELDGRATGFVTLDRVEASRVLEWGFYVDPRSPRGTGRLLGRTALHHAFGERAASRVVGHVLEDNVRSLRLHDWLGFEREGVTGEQTRQPDASGARADRAGITWIEPACAWRVRNVVSFGLQAPGRTSRDP